MLQTALARAVDVLLPGGGQQRARRNAWAGMSDCSARSRATREADAAVRAAVQAAAASRRPLAR